MTQSTHSPQSGAANPDRRPLVSCLMPTADRRAFVPRAVRYFLRQDYPTAELVVLEDGADPVADLMPADPRVRYYRLDHRVVLGAKRNLACEHARGDVLVHWDDDDWQAPTRVRTQVEALLAAGADVCGSSSVLYLDPAGGRGWRYDYPPAGRFWLAGNTLCYRRSYWAGHRFPAVQTGEDARFVWAGRSDRMLRLGGPPYTVGLIHPTNVSPKQTTGPLWTPLPLAEVLSHLGDDRPDFRTPAPAHAVPADREPAPVAAVRNVYACLVHERPECVADLVRNLHALDPNSAIVLYDGGKDPRLLDNGFPFARYNSEVHPRPRPQAWGRLHDFALDCMTFALGRGDFDTLTIVDSDQLAVRPGYSRYLARAVAGRPNLGLLGNCATPQRPGTKVAPAVTALQEIDLWRPFLRRFPGGEDRFVHWSFWPGTVFTAAAARALTDLFARDEQLRGMLARSRMWATEEVLFPTLAAVLGFEVALNPCSYEYVRYKAPYTIADLDRALARPDVYWVHPVPRRYDDRLRAHVRGRFGHYSTRAVPHPTPGGPDLLLTRALFGRMKTIPGWLDEDEADLLLAAAVRALATLPAGHAVVEVGSYCGRATVVLGAAARTIHPPARVYAIDTFDGTVGALDQGLKTGPPTYDRFRATIATAGLTDIVETIRSVPAEVAWDRPIAFLLIDGLHDYFNVARDFARFGPSVAAGGYVAFHDYADYFPGVKAFVHELIAGGGFAVVKVVGSLVVLREVAAGSVA